MSASLAIVMSDATKVGEARRIATALCQELGFDETTTGRAAVVVTELANNLRLHAQDGQLLLSFPGEIPGGAAPLAIEILAIDKGPGMADAGRCVEDGYSSIGTCGNGIGAARRMADTFDFQTLPGVGTVMVARILGRKLDPELARDPFVFGGVSLPIHGEALSGDAWAVSVTKDALTTLVVDGIGHGPAAHDAARAAVATFYESPGCTLVEILKRMHEALRKTRGAAASLATIDPTAGVARFAGIGNVNGVIVEPNGRTRGMLGHNGTLGASVRTFQEFEYPWPRGGQIFLYSDGLKSRLSVDAYPGLLRRDPSVVAGVLHRDFSRGRDDSTIVVAREAHPTHAVRHASPSRLGVHDAP